MNLFILRPNIRNLAGNYVSTDGSHHLELLKNGYFSLSNGHDLDLCKTGKYSLDLNSNKILFNCESSSANADIISGFNNFQIHISVGDPDSGNDVYFKKVK